MKLFLTVYFWLSIIVIVLKVLALGICDYPRETSRLVDSIGLIISIPFLVWVIILLWA
jgi:hypothetical protein